MFHFSNSHIRLATTDHINALVDLLNSAYRGDASKKGWTTEAHLIAGNTRTRREDIEQIMQEPGSIFLVYSNDQSIIEACVNLRKNNGKVYLGMLSVSPLLQGAGIGKILLQAAEEYTMLIYCDTIFMTVISARTELIAWYKRHGYLDTGERKPFIEDEVSGKHLQPLEFMVMEKSLL